MAKDDRLFAKFTLDFADSPKIAPLDDRAFRQYVEAVLWSRRLLTDGLIPQGMVQRMFAPETLHALTSNDPERPSLRQIEGGYVIHDFLESQTSKAEIEMMRLNKSAAGRKSARIRAEVQQKSNSCSTPVEGVLPIVDPTNGQQGVSRIQPETETETDKKNKDSVQATPSRVLESEFAQWWKVYPRKQAKPDALKAFRAARKTADLDTLIKGAQAYALLNLGGDRSKVKMPAGWLRSERWADEDQIAADASTEGAGTAYAFSPSRPDSAAVSKSKYCPIHPDYLKGDWMNPCDRCERDRREDMAAREASGGNEF